jgi:hypothetical protein
MPRAWPTHRQEDAMPRLFASRLGRILTTALIAALAFSAGAAVVAHAQDTPAVIYACVNNSSGTIHIISATGTCSSNEMLLNWNQQGPAGPQGPQGLPGGSGSGGTGTIVGYVGTLAFPWDASTPATPMQGARVSISGTSASTTTDSQGRFVLQNVPAGLGWTIQITQQLADYYGRPSFSTCTVPDVRIDAAGQTLEPPGYYIWGACVNWSR